MLPSHRPDSGTLPVVRCEAFGPAGLLVTLQGECDLLCAEELAHRVGAGLAEGHRHVVVDVAAATLLDCSALGALLVALEPLRPRRDTAVVLAGAHGVVARLLGALPVRDLFEQAPTAEAGILRVCHADAAALVDGWRHVRAEAGGGRGGTLVGGPLDEEGPSDAEHGRA